jgi:hypothetical protein
MDNQSGPIKTEKEIKAEVLGLLGTLKEKLDFVRKCSDKYLVTVYQSLYKDPNFQDGSKISEAQIYQLMLGRETCPEEIVLGCLKMPWFEGQDFAHRSSYVDTKTVDKSCLKVLTEVKVSMGLNQKQLDLLTSILWSPNLSPKMRTRVESLCDKLSKSHVDDSLVSVAVRFTKRPKWLGQKFSEYLKGGAGDMTFINNIVANNLAKPFMVDYACRLCFNPEVANKLVRHPKISIQGLENLRSKFGGMRDYIDKLIQRQVEDNEE